MPSAGIPRACCTWATSVPWLPSCERQPALADLDRPLGGDSAATAACRSPDICGGGHRTRPVQPAWRPPRAADIPLRRVCTRAVPLGSKRSAIARALERALPVTQAGPGPCGRSHPSCPLPFGPTGLADGLALEDALRGSSVRDSPPVAVRPPSVPPFSAPGGGLETRRLTSSTAYASTSCNNLGQRELRSAALADGAEPLYDSAARQSAACVRSLGEQVREQAQPHPYSSSASNASACRAGPSCCRSRPGRRTGASSTSFASSTTSRTELLAPRAAFSSSGVGDTGTTSSQRWIH